jgi:hypothetical protein
MDGRSPHLKLIQGLLMKQFLNNRQSRVSDLAILLECWQDQGALLPSIQAGGRVSCNSSSMPNFTLGRLHVSCGFVYCSNMSRGLFLFRDVLPEGNPHLSLIERTQSTAPTASAALRKVAVEGSQVVSGKRIATPRGEMLLDGLIWCINKQQNPGSCRKMGNVANMTRVSPGENRLCMIEVGCGESKRTQPLNRISIYDQCYSM